MDVSLGVDALLKLVDADGEDMGQACISLTHLVQQDKLGVPYSVEVPTVAVVAYKTQSLISGSGALGAPVFRRAI